MANNAKLLYFDRGWKCRKLFWFLDSRSSLAETICCRISAVLILRIEIIEKIESDVPLRCMIDGCRSKIMSLLTWLKRPKTQSAATESDEAAIQESPATNDNAETL